MAVASLSCTDEANILAPYEGHRPLQLLRITQNFTPDIQWVGGRVGAVGVNRGEEAALDETLVWVMTAGDNSIGSYVTVGQDTDEALISELGGTALDQLVDGETYTFWLAERELLDAGLHENQRDEYNFVSRTLTVQTILRGQAGGGNDAEGNPLPRVRITRYETLLSDRFIMEWDPSDFPFRRIVVKKGPLGGFTDVVWHVVTPDDVADNITSPVIIGEVPEGTDEAVEWQGFEPEQVYFVWLQTDDWQGSFSASAVGYSWFRIIGLPATDGGPDEDPENGEAS